MWPGSPHSCTEVYSWSGRQADEGALGFLLPGLLELWPLSFRSAFFLLGQIPEAMHPTAHFPGLQPRLTEGPCSGVIATSRKCLMLPL